MILRSHIALNEYKWELNLIPHIKLYLESNSPLNHNRLLLDGISGIYFSIGWIKWELSIGVYKSLRTYKKKQHANASI